MHYIKVLHQFTFIIFISIRPSIYSSAHPSIHRSIIGKLCNSTYLLQLSGPGAHKHHGVFSVGVCGHSSHALRAVLVQRVSLDDPQASKRLVQHQAAEVVPDLHRLWKNRKGGGAGQTREGPRKQEADFYEAETRCSRLSGLLARGWG